MRDLFLSLAIAASCGTSAYAYPDGAPWGAANPSSPDTCASCHFDAEPVRPSDYLAVEGLPDAVRPGGRYEMSIVFRPVGGTVAGFQLLASRDGEAAGVLSSDPETTDSVPGAVRSSRPIALTGGARWTVRFTAPDGAGPVRLYIAAIAANGDESPFGDVVHYRSFELSPN